MPSPSSAGLPMDALLIKGSIALLSTLVKLNRTATTAMVLLYLAAQEERVNELQMCRDLGFDINFIAATTGSLMRSALIDCHRGNFRITDEGQLEVFTMLGAMTLTALEDAITDGNARDFEAEEGTDTTDRA